MGTFSSQLKLKVCGMKYSENLKELVSLKPGYIGFIFYSKSPRYYMGENFSLPEEIQKVGVFVNASLGEIEGIMKKHQLQVIQLHGDESVEFCKEFKALHPQKKIWKSFSIGNSFEFGKLNEYDSVDAILFDTKGENYGGNGLKFDWKLLESLPIQKEIILSGGIHSKDVVKIKELKERVPQITTIDINSRFELEPGRKNIELIKEFVQNLKR